MKLLHNILLLVFSDKNQVKLWQFLFESLIKSNKKNEREKKFKWNNILCIYDQVQQLNKLEQ